MVNAIQSALERQVTSPSPTITLTPNVVLYGSSFTVSLQLGVGSTSAKSLYFAIFEVPSGRQIKAYRKVVYRDKPTSILIPTTNFPIVSTTQYVARLFTSDGVTLLAEASLTVTTEIIQTRIAASIWLDIFVKTKNEKEVLSQTWVNVAPNQYVDVVRIEVWEVTAFVAGTGEAVLLVRDENRKRQISPEGAGFAYNLSIPLPAQLLTEVCVNYPSRPYIKPDEGSDDPSQICFIDKLVINVQDIG